MESYQRTQALVLLEDMANRLRANRIGKSSYVLSSLGIPFLGYGSSFDGTGCPDVRACQDLLDWQKELSGSAEKSGRASIGAMIGARGCIAQDVAGNFLVTVAWQGMTADSHKLADLPANDPRRTNDCGQGAYGSDAQRRIVSVPVRFFTS